MKQASNADGDEGNPAVDVRKVLIYRQAMTPSPFRPPIKIVANRDRSYRAPDYGKIISKLLFGKVRFARRAGLGAVANPHR